MTQRQVCVSFRNALPRHVRFRQSDAVSTEEGAAGETFGQTLARLMKERGVKVAELARRLAAAEDVPEARRAQRARNLRSQVQKWLRGENVPGAANRKKLEAALGLPAGALATPEPQRVRRHDAELADINLKLDLLIERLGVVVPDNHEGRGGHLELLREIRHATNAIRHAIEGVKTKMPPEILHACMALDHAVSRLVDLPPSEAVWHSHSRAPGDRPPTGSVRLRPK